MALFHNMAIVMPVVWRADGCSVAFYMLLWLIAPVCLSMQTLYEHVITLFFCWITCSNDDDSTTNACSVCSAIVSFIHTHLCSAPGHRAMASAAYIGSLIGTIYAALGLRIYRGCRPSVSTCLCTPYVNAWTRVYMYCEHKVCLLCVCMPPTPCMCRSNLCIPVNACICTYMYVWYAASTFDIVFSNRQMCVTYTMYALAHK